MDLLPDIIINMRIKQARRKEASYLTWNILHHKIGMRAAPKTRYLRDALIMSLSCIITGKIIRLMIDV
jgi:hypothetical protein